MTENKSLLTVETVSNVHFTPEPKTTTSSVVQILVIMMKLLPSTVHVQDVHGILNQTQQKDNVFVAYNVRELNTLFQLMEIDVKPAHDSLEHKVETQCVLPIYVE